MNPKQPIPAAPDGGDPRLALEKALHDAAAMHRNLVELNEKLRRAEEVKARFLAHMRNEINNPLTDIMGLADRIADPGVPLEKARELAALIRDEAFALNCQIQDVFSAAELEAGQADPFLARVDVASVVLDVLESFGPAAKAKGLELAFRPEGDLAAFPTDGEKLHHIVANLLANAVQCAAPSGRVEIRVLCADRLQVKVLDHGPGIPEEELRAIFDPFHLHEGPYSDHRGQSLGLPVVKALVDLLDGDLHVKSEPGRGSSFEVSLPRASAVFMPQGEGTDGNILFFDDPQAF